MHFAREDFSAELSIRAYAAGEITVGQHSYRNSLILSRQGVIADWRPQRHQELTEQDFEIIESLRPEIILLGTGSGLHFPPPGITARLLGEGIGVEVMDTAAACRTYNILLSEERQVVAALLLR
jgi:uncharacterized protein